MPLWLPGKQILTAQFLRDAAAGQANVKKEDYHTFALWIHDDHFRQQVRHAPFFFCLISIPLCLSLSLSHSLFLFLFLWVS